jgi:hypothetical protein
MAIILKANKVNSFVSSVLFVFIELLQKPETLTSYIYIYMRIYISYLVAQLCVNTLLATKVTLITDGI